MVLIGYVCLSQLIMANVYVSKSLELHEGFVESLLLGTDRLTFVEWDIKVMGRIYDEVCCLQQ